MGLVSVDIIHNTIPAPMAQEDHGGWGPKIVTA